MNTYFILSWSSPLSGAGETAGAGPAGISGSSFALPSAS